MLLPIVFIGLALFVLAFVGLNKVVPLIIGIVCIVGLILGLYLVWMGFTANSENRFIWGCFVMLASGGVLVFLKTSFSD